MDKLSGKNKEKIYIALSAFFLLLVTFFTDTKMFTKAPLNMNSLPVDLEAVPLMHILSKILVFVFFYVFLRFLYAAVKNKTLLIPFLILITIYLVGLLLTYPGYYMSDDPIIFAYATRYYPVYWHNYLTSLFYMTAMSVFPASCGPVLLNDIICAMVYSYIFYEGYHVFSKKSKYALAMLGICPFVLLGALMCFRPAIYSSFFVLYYAILFFDQKNKRELTASKFLILTFLTAVLAFWRSEGILLIVFGAILSIFAYKNIKIKKSLLFVLFIFTVVIFFSIIKIPQSIGEDKYYGKDYSIIATTRPLSVIVHREQTYEGANEDLANISKITDFGYLHNDSLSCSAYNRYNTDHNEGKYTQTGASIEDQKAYLKSAIRLIANNLDLYLGERLQLFLVTNGFYGYNTDIVLGLKPVVTTDFHLYEHDRSYGFEMLEEYKRVPVNGTQKYALFLFAFGGEAYLPMLIIVVIVTVILLIRRRWFGFIAFLSILSREVIIFLTAPASFIQYSYPMMYVAAFLIVFELLEYFERSSQSDEQR